MEAKIVLGAMIVAMAAGWLMEPVLAARAKAGAQTAVSSSEAADLLYMREEEKLARDVYTLLYAQWDARVFGNIQSSEQNHMDVLLGLLGKYGLADPALEPGRFADPELQALFDALMESGLESKRAALAAGAMIEEVDIADIAAAMTRTDKPDIRTVYGNLAAASENHLRAFVRNLEALTGETYVAQRLPQEQVDVILGR